VLDAVPAGAAGIAAPAALSERCERQGMGGAGAAVPPEADAGPAAAAFRTGAARRDPLIITTLVLGKEDIRN